MLFNDMSHRVSVGHVSIFSDCQECEKEMEDMYGAQVARKEAGENRIRIGIAFVVELNDDANVIDITPLREEKE
jgi:hypothetical protein